MSFLKTMPVVTALVMTLSSPSYAGVCEWFGGGTAATSAVIASTSTAAQAGGVMAVMHSSGGVILTSVGTGGTGYIAGTLGTAAATGLAVVSSPAVIVGAIGTAVVGGGTAAYCYLSS
jgi:hypothetical protein